jgi:hypothetical protein
MFSVNYKRVFEKEKEKRMKESGKDFVLSGPNLWPQKYQVTIPSGHCRLT